MSSHPRNLVNISNVDLTLFLVGTVTEKFTTESTLPNTFLLGRLTERPTPRKSLRDGFQGSSFRTEGSTIHTPLVIPLGVCLWLTPSSDFRFTSY